MPLIGQMKFECQMLSYKQDTALTIIRNVSNAPS
jgi:hypothetical protein